MGVERLLQGLAGGGREERRKSERVRCRLHCSLKRGRRWLRARVLDVSENGLCLLSPIELQVRQAVVVRIEVPGHGPVEVEATAWHKRRVKAGSGGKKAWSVGMMITRADEGFRCLLPGAESDPEAQARAEAEALRTLHTPRPRRARAAAPPAPPEASEIETEPLGLPGDAVEIDLLADEDTAPDGSEPTGLSLHLFRVRVKSVGGPRTRSLTLGASSADEAAALARADLEGEWAVLDVRRA